MIPALRAWRRADLLSVMMCGLLACSGNSDRRQPGDSAGAAPALLPDAAGPDAPLASDATLVIQTTPAIIEALLAVTHSFVSREAIKVRFASDGETTTGALTISPLADLVIVPGNQVTRLPADSAAWTLPFAMWRPTSPGPTVRRDSSATAVPARSPIRRSRRRRPPGPRTDSLEADSARRLAVFRDRVRADSVRADSARVLVLTIPASAPNSSVAERFVRYILTDGRAELGRAGLVMLPRLVLRGEAGPPGVRAVIDTVIPREFGPGGDSVLRR